MNNSNIHKSGYIIFIYFIMTQFVGIIGIQLLAKTGLYDVQENRERAIQQILVHWELIGFLLTLLIVFIIYNNELIKEPRLSIKLSKSSWGWILAGIVLVFLAQMIGSFLDKSVFQLSTHSENTSNTVAAVSISPIAIVSIVILAPLVEELVFRYATMNILIRKCKEVGSIVISALFFAIMHFDFPFIFGYFFIGIVLAFVYARSKQLLVSYIVHAMMNFIVVMIHITQV